MQSRAKRAFRWVMCGVGVIIIAALVVLALLAFGNPQWSGYIYRFQCYAWPSKELKQLDYWQALHRIPAPDGYTGRWTTWYRNGQRQTECWWSDGLANGTYTMWDEDGNKVLEDNYRDGREHGISRSWYPNGQLFFEYSFLKGKLHGKWRKWDKNGNLLEERYYENGEMISVGIPRT